MPDEKRVLEFASQFPREVLLQAIDHALSQKKLQAKAAKAAKRLTKADARPIAFDPSHLPPRTTIKFIPPPQEPSARWYCPKCHRFMRNCDMRHHTRPKHPHYRLLLCWPRSVRVKEFKKSHTGVAYRAMIQDVLELLEYGE